MAQDLSPEDFAKRLRAERQPCAFCEDVQDHKLILVVDRAHADSKLGAIVLTKWLRVAKHVETNPKRLQIHWDRRERGTHP